MEVGIAAGSLVVENKHFGAVIDIVQIGLTGLESGEPNK